MKVKLLCICILFFPHLSFAQFAPETDPHRGMYIDDFFKMNGSNSNVDTSLSILTIDSNHDGIFEKEDQVLRYACENHITYLALYDTHRIFGRHRSAWNENSKQYEDIEKHLCRFIAKAKSNYGITQIGAIGGSVNSFDSISTFMDRYPLTSPIHLDSSITSSPYFNQKLRIVEKHFSVNSEEAQQAEFLKYAFNVIHFNSVNSCQASIDVLNVEYEFWGYCNTEFQNFYDIIVNMNSIKQIYNQNHQHQLITEAYLAFLYTCSTSPNEGAVVQTMDGCNSCAPFPGTTNPHPALIDRMLYSFLQPNPYTFVFGDQNFFEGSTTSDSTDFHPMFYSECQRFGGTFDFMGTWLATAATNTIFFAENYYFYHFLNSSGSALGTPRQNDVQAGGVHWFTSSYMVGHLDHPKMVQTTGPFCSAGATTPVTLTYYGPSEPGTDFEFSITRDSDQLVVYPYSTNVISGTSISTIPSPAYGAINFRDTILFPPVNLPIGNYTANLSLKYNHSSACSYSTTCPVIISDQPRIQVIGDTIFCQGNTTFLVAPTGYFYTWYKNGKVIAGQSQNYLSVTSEGNYYCMITSGSCAGNSNSIHINVLPNPAVTISSKCNGNGTITLRADLAPFNSTSTIANGPGGVTYLWETGATTDQITITATPGTSANYHLKIYDPYSGCSIKRSHFIPANPDSLTAHVYVVSAPSSPCSSDGVIAAELLPAAAVTGPTTYLWSTGDITPTVSGLPPGNYSVTMNLYKNACSSNGSIALGTLPTNSPTLTPTLSNPSCSNSNNGSIHLAISGGNPPFTFYWDNIPTLNNHNSSLLNQDSLYGGQYKLHVYDSGGCEYSFTYSLTPSHRNPIGNIVSVTPVLSCSSNSSGSASVNATGGTAPYVYQWNDALLQTGANATNLTSGTFNVNVIDANSCSTLFFVHIPASVTPILASKIDSGTTSVACPTSTTGSLFIEISGGQPPYSINSPWILNGTIASRINLASGNYTLAITDANGCTITSNYNITSNPILLSVQSSSSDTIICNGSNSGSLTIQIDGGLPPYIVNSPWMITNNSANLPNLTAGVYSLTVTDSGGCIQNSDFTIYENTAIEATLLNSSDTILNCFNPTSGSLNIDVSGGSPPYSINSPWTISGTTASQTGLGQGSYPLSITDGQNCLITENYTINNYYFEVSSNSNNTTCSGCPNGNISVLVSGGSAPYTISYSPSIGVLNNTTIENLLPGIYNVCVSDSNNCQLCFTDTILDDPTFVTTINSHYFKIYPNPNHGTFTVSSDLLLNKNSSIQLFSMDGKLIYKINTNGSKEIAIDPNLESGIYYLEISLENIAIQKNKVVIIRE